MNQNYIPRIENNYQVGYEGVTGNQLDGRISRVRRDFERDYQRILQDVTWLRDRMNRLELSISECGNVGAEHMRELHSLTERLNAIVDSLVLESEKKWEEYDKLERECNTGARDHPELYNLKLICKRTEEFAQDLLCYSLGHFNKE